MMRFDRFTERAQEAAQRAAEIIQRYGHNQIDTEHFLLALIEQPGGVIPQILEKLSISSEALIERLDATLRASPKANIFGGGAGQIYITPRVKRIIDLSNEEANRLKDEYISTEHVFLAILTERNTPAARILESSGLTRDRVYTAIQDLRGGLRASDPNAETHYGALDKYSRDLTQLAREGKLDPVIGRDKEILDIIKILGQRKKNHPLIVGYPGIGKTALIHGLAQRIAVGEVPQSMLGMTIRVMDFYGLLAGSRFRGELEERVNSLITVLQELRTPCIFFMDDLQEHFENTSFAIIQILQPAIFRGVVQVIGSTTVDAYENHFKANPIFSRSFAPLYLKELFSAQVIEVITALKPAYESHHQVTISPEAIVMAVNLTNRYFKERYQPEKSIEVIDQVAAGLHLQQLRLPPTLQSEQIRLEKLRQEEEQAGLSRDYQRAADVKAQRLDLENQLEQKIKKWQEESGISTKLTEKEIIQYFCENLGISEDKLLSGETTLSDLAQLAQTNESEASMADFQLGEGFKQKYEIKSFIGRGGSGEVWKAKNIQLDREEAIKLIPPGAITSRRVMERFRREAQMTAGLNHPNIVTIYDTGEEGGRRYIAMEYIDGPNLAQILDQRGRLPIEKTRMLALQICEALSYAHRQGVVHRDIKPSNILIKGDLAKITDFGVSVLIKETITEYTGMVAGTPAYRAPEQIRGWEPDKRTDIYSLGVTLYELLTGERPFHGVNVEYQHINETPLLPSHFSWEVPPSFDDVILRCLMKNPIDRYQSADELRDALMELPEPVSIDPLVKLLKARHASEEPPYNLILGSASSLSSGCIAVTQMVDSVISQTRDVPVHSLSRNDKLQHFMRFVQHLSTSERYSLLKKYLEGSEPSPGYKKLAELMKAGYFSVVFTSNVDVMLEEAMHRAGIQLRDYQVVNLGDELSPDYIRDALQHRSPHIKIVKLHGDINSHKFAFTPQDIISISDSARDCLAEHMANDLIMVCLDLQDIDVSRYISTKGGSIWYVNPYKQIPDPNLAVNPRLTKSDKQMIWGDNGYFDRFFGLLYRELVEKNN